MGLTTNIGTHVVDTDRPETMPICWLHKWGDDSGQATVPVFRDNIFEAWMDAIGAPPVPEVVGPGELVPIHGQTTQNLAGGVIGTFDVITGYAYNPAPDNENAAIVAATNTAIASWSAFANILLQLLNTFIANLKPLPTGAK